MTAILIIAFACTSNCKTIGPLLFLTFLCFDYFTITETAKIIWGQP